MVSLPRDTEGKSADVEVFTLLTAVRASGTLSTQFFIISTSNPSRGAIPCINVLWQIIGLFLALAMLAITSVQMIRRL